jgi:hypothetical protein
MPSLPCINPLPPKILTTEFGDATLLEFFGSLRRRFP